MDEQAKRPTIGVYHGMPLTDQDLLGGIEAAWTAASRRFHRLAADHRRRRARLPAAMFPIGGDEPLTDVREHANRPSSRQSRNRRHIVDHGCKSDGINRKASPTAGHRRCR